MTSFADSSALVKRALQKTVDRYFGRQVADVA